MSDDIVWVEVRCRHNIPQRDGCPSCYRRCTACRLVRPLDLFYRTFMGTHETRCRDCKRDVSTARRRAAGIRPRAEVVEGRPKGTLYDLRTLLTLMTPTGWSNERHFIPCPRPSHTDLATQLGVSRETLEKRLARGVSAKLADEMAIRVGLHPAAVWPNWED